MSIDIARLRALHAAATPGPWEHGTGYEQAIPGHYVHGNVVVAASNDGPEPYGIEEDDAALIVAMHAALPGLLDEVERLRLLADSYEKMLYARAAPRGDK